MKTSKLHVVFFLIFVFLFIGVLGGGIIASEKPTGSISGMVFDEKGVNSLKNATVGINNSFFSKDVSTNDDGTFRLIKIPVGSYSIHASAPGYDTKWSNKDVGVKEGEEVANLRFQLYEKDPQLYINTYNRVYTQGEKVVIKIRSTLVENADIRLYKVNIKDWFEKEGELSTDSLFLKQWQMNLINKKEKDSDYDENRFELPITKEGGYVIKIQGYSTKKTLLRDNWWFIISDISLVTKQEPGKILTYATSFNNKAPLKDVNIEIYRSCLEEVSNTSESCKKGKITSGITNNDGIYVSKIEENENTYRIVAYKNDSAAFTYSNVYLPYHKHKIYTYTDRPVYRPEQKVYFKGIVRKTSKGQNVLDVSPSVSVTINDSNGEKIYEKTLQLNSYGSFSDSFLLTKEPPLGEYTISADIDEDTHYSYFKVLEYRKPEFKIDIKTNKAIYIGGEQIQATISTNYYFGAPVPGANVNYTVYVDDDWSSSSLEQEDFYSGYDDSGTFSYGGYGEVFTQGQDVTDEKGELKITINSKKIEPESSNDMLRNKRYTIEVEATELSRKPVKNTASVKVVKGEYEIYLKTNKYIYEPDNSILLDIKIISWDNKAVTDTPLQVILHKEEYKDNNYNLIKMQTLDTKIDKTGRAISSIPSLKEGYYIITVKGKDKLENTIISQCYIWVTGNQYWGSNYDYKTIDLVLDKKTYKPDDTVKALINSPDADVYALLTIEGQTIHDYQILHIKGHSRIVNIPLKQEYLPAVYVSVCFTSKKEFFSKQKIIKISPEEKFINIKVETNKKRYEPGEDISYNITTTDIKNNPIRTELSLGVVDASIYAIEPDMTPDIRKFFYRPESNRIETNYSYAYDYSGGVEKEESIKVRKKFEDTAFWEPHVFTDETGKASISFKLPDNLTTWIATIRAADKDTYVGQAYYDVVATKPLLVRLSPPRFFTQGDRLILSGIVHNYTENDLNIKLKIKAKNIELLDNPELSVLVKKDGSYRYDWHFHAKNHGNVKITIYAISEAANDAMELTIPSLAHGIQKFINLTGQVKDDEEEKEIAFEIPKTILPDTLNLQLNLTPTPASAMMGALPYMQDYPYYCVEQTMSMILTNIVTLNTIKNFGLHNFTLKEKTQTSLDTGLRRLYDYQHSDGGWGWWSNDESQVFLSSYVLYGFHLLKENNIDINQNSINRGCEFLEKAVKDIDADVNSRYVVDFGAGYDTRAYATYAFSWHKQVQEKELDKLFADKDKLSNYSLALFAATLDNNKQTERASQILKDLDNKKLTSPMGVHWESKSVRYSWLDNDVEATGYALKAYVQINKDSPDLPEIVNWLINNRQGAHWSSTKDTSVAIFALGDYLKQVELKTMPDYVTSAYHQDKLLGEFPINRFNLFEDDRLIKLTNEQIPVGENKIKITKNGAGNLHYSLGIGYFDQQENIPPSAKGLTVIREYFVFNSSQISETRDEWTFADYFTDRVVKELTPVPGRIKGGSKILVRLTVVADDNYHYLMVEDPLPAGCEVMEDDQKNTWNYWWSYHEIKDEKMVFFITHLKKGVKKLYYIMQTEIPGNYHVLPTLASCMYIPEVRGNSAENRLLIEE